jgi:hypothetical protein
LVSGGGELHLLWMHKPLAAQPTSLYARRWDGAAFTEQILGDARDVGISFTGGVAQSLAAAIGADGLPSVAWEDASGHRPEVLVRTNRLDLSGAVHVASAATLTVQQILDANALGPGDVILVTGTLGGAFTVTAADAGVAIMGAPGSHLVGSVQISGDDVVLQRMWITGNVTTNSADRFALRESIVTGNVTINGGVDVQLSHNTINASSPGILLAGNTNHASVRDNTVLGGGQAIALGDPAGVLAGGALDLRLHGNATGGAATGILIAAASEGQIFDNDVSATGTALELDAPFSGPIHRNMFRDAAVGVRYDLAAELGDNDVFNNITGIVASVDSIVDGLGFVAGTTPNRIHGNTVGVSLTGRMRDQHIFANTTGVTGSGILGGESLDWANLIEGNVTGVNFAGTIQFNRIAANQTGVLAQSEQLIHQHGLFVNYRNDVRVVQNTFYGVTGDNIRVDGGSSEVEVRNNILWTETGYDLWVNYNSQGGFFSDYNTLYAGPGGTLVHWILDFTDILDWQEDVHRNDLHSQGTTRVNPGWSRPQFLNKTMDDFRVFDPWAGQRLGSPTIDTGDPRIDLALPSSYQNLLTNPSFESGLAGWTTNLTAMARTGSPDPFDGGAYFAAQTDEVGFAEQTVNLISAGLIPAQLDSRDLVVVFGGRVRSANEAVPDVGLLLLTFLDAGDAEISTLRYPASNTTDRWELIGDRTQIPVGTRKIVIRFQSSRLSGSTSDSFFDAPFLYVLPEKVAPDQGAYGNSTYEIDGSAPRMFIQFPDLYTDWEKGVPRDIRWTTLGNADDLPVRIDLYQDTPNGPEPLLSIAATTDDDGSFTWIPENDGIGFGTYGLRIHVSLVNSSGNYSAAYDRSTESFTVPEDGNNFYVNDQDLTNDQYTSAIGDNRKTARPPQALSEQRIENLHPGSRPDALQRHRQLRAVRPHGGLRDRGDRRRRGLHLDRTERPRQDGRALARQSADRGPLGGTQRCRHRHHPLPYAEQRTARGLGPQRQYPVHRRTPDYVGSYARRHPHRGRLRIHGIALHHGPEQRPVRDLRHLAHRRADRRSHFRQRRRRHLPDRPDGRDAGKQQGLRQRSGDRDHHPQRLRRGHRAGQRGLRQPGRRHRRDLPRARAAKLGTRQRRPRYLRPIRGRGAGERRLWKHGGHRTGRLGQ